MAAFVILQGAPSIREISVPATVERLERPFSVDLGDGARTVADPASTLDVTMVEFEEGSQIVSVPIALERFADFDANGVTTYIPAAIPPAAALQALVKVALRNLNGSSDSLVDQVGISTENRWSVRSAI